MHRSPARAQFLFGASMVAVFLLTTLFLNPPDISTPRRKAVSVHSMPIFRASPNLAEHLVAKPAATQAPVQPAPSQVASSATPPIADPATFGSEAYQPIYSD